MVDVLGRRAHVLYPFLDAYGGIHVLGWLRKSTQRPQTELPPGLQQLFARTAGPLALAAGLAAAVAEHMKDVKEGRSSYPAYKRKNSSVVEVWRDTRLEAFSTLWGFGQSEPALLADFQQQVILLRCLLDDRPYLHLRQPAGEKVADTIQALWQTYCHLNKAGTSVADPKTDRTALYLAGRDIFSDLTERAAGLRQEWHEYKAGLEARDESRPAMPKTLFEIAYEDVTAKAKTIALAAQFGPDWTKNMQMMVDRLREQMRKERRKPQEIEKFVNEAQTTWQHVLNAKDPDAYVKSTNVG